MVRHGEKWRDQDFMKVIILKLDLAKLLLSELNILVNVFVFLCSYDRTHFIVQEFFFSILLLEVILVNYIVLEIFDSLMQLTFIFI